MKINIENPNKLIDFVSKSLTSWKIHYVGENPTEGIYEYVLKDKENPNIKILVQIHKETQRMYDPTDSSNEEYVKIYCNNVNQPLARGCTKFLRVNEFKDMRRVFNHIHSGARQVL
jgi:tRNA uridine 5-carbamoylmethylation protein Kti12